MNDSKFVSPEYVTILFHLEFLSLFLNPTHIRPGMYVRHRIMYEKVLLARNWWIFCLFDLIIYIPSTIFQLNRDGSSWVEPVLS